MKALIVNESRVDLYELPPPQLMNSESVLVDVLTAGICRTDIAVASGHILGIPGQAFGHEFSGRIVARGGAVRHLSIGQRVAVNPVISCGECDFCRQNKTYLCANTGLLGIHEPGVFCEQVSIPANRCFPVSESLSDALVAYAEPVAAMLSVLDAGIEVGARVAVLGDDRIADLCRYMLRSNDIEVSIDHSTICDAVVVCSAIEDLDLEQVKPGGLVVVKTRLPLDLRINMAAMVQRRIRIVGANYAPFEKAITFLEQHAENLSQFVGDMFALAEHDRAFSRPNNKKSFFKICVD